jgi:hypothetical protein
MRKSLVAAVLAASSLVLASCAMPADDPNFNAAEAAFPGEASAEAEAATGASDSVTAALAAPSTIGVDSPLAAAPAAGSLIVSLSDGSEQDALLSASMAEAAKTIGWEFQEVAGLDPADLFTTAPAAFEEALALKPAGIHISGAYVDAMSAISAALAPRPMMTDGSNRIAVDSASATPSEVAPDWSNAQRPRLTLIVSATNVGKSMPAAGSNGSGSVEHSRHSVERLPTKAFSKVTMAGTGTENISTAASSSGALFV